MRASSARMTFVFCNQYIAVVPGLDPPARPKPLRRGEGPGTHEKLETAE
jgi:hypothetical protein